MSALWAAPGVMVTPIADWSIRWRLYGYAVPERGRVYVIRDVVQETTRLDGHPGGPGILLEEIRNPRETAFEIHCFRPVRPTSIEQLRSLLRPTLAGTKMREDA